ncbi:MAG: enoyl-CoA hydratase [bacterium]|nr:enoyl-CoA hydratase [bacterium]
MTESVVDLQEIEEGIVLLKMEDRINKNTFSMELTSGLQQSFEAIANNSRYKVVILTGYDTYFCSGGTKKGLLAIHDGNAQFTDLNIYALPLECKIPVIAAMQGHGIGGGFAFGLFSDFVILSRESVYTTNFMKYGFTPGMGSTLILSEKLGISLAEELLLTANNYRGAELEKRGIPFPVFPRKDVVNYALELARQLAEKPRIALSTLKDHLVASLREKLPTVTKKEIAMHEKTFHLPEVKERILKLFGR